MKVSSLAYWIAFGPHGPRALPPPGENWHIFGYTMLGIGISFIIFVGIRSMARPAPGTMTAQYQEMTNEYLKVRPGPERHPMSHPCRALIAHANVAFACRTKRQSP